VLPEVSWVVDSDFNGFHSVLMEGLTNERSVNALYQWEFQDPS
jgi:hypothetical protein